MELLLLAISYKNNGLCVAGIDYKTYRYVRIGHANGNECGPIRPDELVINGSQCQIMDVISIDVKKMPVNGCQTENYDLIKINDYVKTITYAELIEIYNKINHPSFVFHNNYYKVYPKDIDNVKNSLELVRVSNLKVFISKNYKSYDAPYADFNYNQNKYDKLRVTDCVCNGFPFCYKRKLQEGDQFAYLGNHKEAFVMVSLPYDEWSLNNGFFKYIAGIILP